MKVPTPKALHPKAQGRATARPQSTPWVTGRNGLLAPKALHPTAQGRTAAKPQSAPWDTDRTIHKYPEGVLQITTRRRNGTTSAPLCNAFGVWGGFGGSPTQGAPCRADPGLRNITASRYGDDGLPDPFFTPKAFHPKAQGRATARPQSTPWGTNHDGLPTPKAFYPTAQGRVAVKPHSAPWVTAHTTREYPEGVSHLPETMFDQPHDHEMRQHRHRCVTPSAYGVCFSHQHPGCAANNGFAVSRRPWAMEYDRFAVKRR